MFGIGLPEMIVILAVALIVVGPDKLPELARSLAKGVNELKNTMNQVKDSLNEETKVVSSVQQDLQQTAGHMKTQLLENVTTSPSQWKQEGGPVPGNAEQDDVIEAEPASPSKEEQVEVVENSLGHEDSSAERENREGEDTSASDPASAS
jgi:sec-independent protein translocase protein TatB